MLSGTVAAPGSTWLRLAAGQQLTIVVDRERFLRECIGVISAVKIVSLATILAVLCVFITPSIDLPDTVKVSSTALVAIFAVALLLPVDAAADRAQVFGLLPLSTSDLPTRMHSLRI